MMKNMKILLVAGLGLILSGCVTKSSTAKTAGKGKLEADTEVAYLDQKVCETRAFTGSHIKKRRCITRRQRELEREAAQEVLREVNSGDGEFNDIDRNNGR